MKSKPVPGATRNTSAKMVIKAMPSATVTHLLEAVRFPIRSDIIYDLLIKSTGAGPFDGGCVVMAQALQKVYGGEIWALVGSAVPGEPSAVQHAVLRSGDLFYDADGPATLDEVIRRFSDAEGIRINGARVLGPRDLPEAPRDNKAAAKIATLLTQGK